MITQIINFIIFFIIFITTLTNIASYILLNYIPTLPLTVGDNCRLASRIKIQSLNTNMVSSDYNIRYNYVRATSSTVLIENKKNQFIQISETAVTEPLREMSNTCTCLRSEMLTVLHLERTHRVM